METRNLDWRLLEGNLVDALEPCSTDMIAAALITSLSDVELSAVYLALKKKMDRENDQ